MKREIQNNFYWGNSVSSMQTEGAYNEGGKGASVYDLKEASEFLSDWKVATDSYHRYLEDFDLMKELGMNMYRFQISWSRVCPSGDGDFNEEGIAFYDKFIDDLLSRGIEPMVCLYHFDMPLALAEKYNGFVNRSVYEKFVRYGKEMMDRFAHKVKYWITFNEQNHYHVKEAFNISGYLKGNQTLEELYYIQHHVMLAHAELSNYLNDKHPKCEIGGMLAYMEVYPATCKPQDVFAVNKFDEFANFNLMEVFVNGKYSRQVLTFMEEQNLMHIIQKGDLETLSRVKSDWISFSYYRSSILNSNKLSDETAPNDYLVYGEENNPTLPLTEWNWEIDALGFRDVITKLYDRYRIPVFPIENGIGAIEEWDGESEIDDSYRIEYHEAHIQAMKDAMFIDGVEVIGYLGWGLIDILSSRGDMRKRYGVVYVNRDNHDLKDMKRVKKKSFNWLKEVIKTNAKDI